MDLHAQRQEMVSDCIRRGAFSGRYDSLLRGSVAGALRIMGALLLETMAASFPKAVCGNFGSGALYRSYVEDNAFVFASVFSCVLGRSYLRCIQGNLLRIISRRLVLACARHGLDHRGGADQQREYWFGSTAGGRIGRLVVSLHTAGWVRFGEVENQCFC